MLIAFPIAPREKEQAFRLINWICEIGAGKNHDAVLILGRGVTFHDEIRPLFDAAFKSVDCHVIPVEAGSGWFPAVSGDATTANNMFTWASLYCDEVLKRAFLLNEMDAIPTRTTSYDELDAAYAECLSLGKPFMGCKISNGVQHDYINGVAVYPTNIPQYSVTIRNCGAQAWDVASGREVIPHSYFTPLIENYHWLWNNGGGVCHAEEKYNGQAALFHQCKCGCLINRLRGIPHAEKRDVGSVIITPISNTTSDAILKITDKDHIAALSEIAKKDGFAKARIVKQLKAAGFELNKKRKVKKHAPKRKQTAAIH